MLIIYFLFVLYLLFIYMKQNYTFKMTMTKLNDRKKAANLSNPINVLKLES